MPSRVWSALGQLDSNLQVVQLEVERLRAALEVSDDQSLRASLMDACAHAALVRDLVRTERPDADWSDRESLELLVIEQEQAARECLSQQRRARLLALAEELESGNVRHRFEGRTESLNALRRAAVDQLRALAAEPEQEKDLPGPNASQWLHWACNLDERHDVSVLQQLRSDFDALDRFATEIEETYWFPARRGNAPTVAPAESAATTSTPAEISASAGEGRPSSPGNVPPLHTIIAIGSTAATGVRLSPVSQSSTAPPNQSMEPPHEPQASQDSLSESADPPMPTFGEIASDDRHTAPWIVVAAVIVSIALVAGIYHFRSKRSNADISVASAQGPSAVAPASQQPQPAELSPSHPTTADPQQPKPADQKPPADTTSPPSAADSKSAASLLHKQPAEGTQDNIGLSVESCARVNAQNIECWGYLSNLRGNESKISLYRVNAVDGKGNSFDLTSGAQPGFSSHNFKVPAQSRVKYSVNVPDADPDARTLTLYLDVNNPRNVEYTFRDIPIAE